MKKNVHVYKSCPKSMFPLPQTVFIFPSLAGVEGNAGSNATNIDYWTDKIYTHVHSFSYFSMQINCFYVTRLFSVTLSAFQLMVEFSGCAILPNIQMKRIHFMNSLILCRIRTIISVLSFLFIIMCILFVRHFINIEYSSLKYIRLLSCLSPPSS
jgi:hypothetical protein